MVRSAVPGRAGRRERPNRRPGAGALRARWVFRSPRCRQNGPRQGSSPGAEEMLMDTLEAHGADKLRQEYLERARELRPMLIAAGDEIERRREVTSEIVDALVERGIFRMLLPKSLGGAELDPLTYTAVLEELAQGDGSTAWCLGQNSGCSMIAPYLPADTAEEVFGGPRGILAWGPDLPGAGRTVAAAGGYRLTGRWGFATGSRHASWLGRHATVFHPDGSTALPPNGRQQAPTVV